MRVNTRADACSRGRALASGPICKSMLATIRVALSSRPIKAESMRVSPPCARLPVCLQCVLQHA